MSCQLHPSASPRTLTTELFVSTRWYSGWGPECLTYLLRQSSLDSQLLWLSWVPNPGPACPTDCPSLQPQHPASSPSDHVTRICLPRSQEFPMHMVGAVQEVIIEQASFSLQKVAGLKTHVSFFLAGSWWSFPSTVHTRLSTSISPLQLFSSQH
jgi:hypothetical protein